MGDIEELRAKEYSDTAAGQKKGKSSGEFQPQQSEEFQVREDVVSSAANRLIGEVVQSRRRPLLGPSPG